MAGWIQWFRYVIIEVLYIALCCFNPPFVSSCGWKMAAGAIRLNTNLAWDRVENRGGGRERENQTCDPVILS